MKYLFAVLLLLGLATSLSPQPYPSCTLPTFMPSTFPIALNQVQSYNLDDYFTGFNLQFSLANTTPNFVFITNKTFIEKQLDIKQPGLKSYHFDSFGNQWGRSLITLSSIDGVTKIRYNSELHNQTHPDLDKEVIVARQKTTQCFDVVWLRDIHLAIVDCVIPHRLIGLQNIFIYVNTSSQIVLPQIQNDMYVSYSKITKRRMLLLREGRSNYLIRAYFGDSVDERHSDNTYLQIMVFINPFKIRTLRVLDRSILDIKKLTITDIQLYLGNIYLLDYHSGLFVFDFTQAQDLIIIGRYATNSGYLRVGIFSSNLQDEVLLALANHHSIYEIDFTIASSPTLITKYSIMSNATVISVLVNQQYVFAQISVNVTNTTGHIIWYNSTLVFSRNTRSYLNAYQIFQHQTSNVIIDLERSTNKLLIMQENYVKYIKLDKPILFIRPISQASLNQQYKIPIYGFSVNTYNGRSHLCIFDMNFTVVELNSKKMFPTGFVLPQVYYATYPGELFIPLTRYVIGPNITWGVYENYHPNMSSFWILQQNDTLIDWDPISMFSINFLRQQQFDSIGQTQLYIYIQNTLNNTFIVKCHTVPYTQHVNCTGNKNNGTLPAEPLTISSLTAHRWNQFSKKFVHVAAIVYQTLRHKVYFYDADEKQPMLTPLQFSPKPYEGNVTNIQFLGHFLAVLQRYSKQILFFDIRSCIDYQTQPCRQIFRIDARMMQRMGVFYFSPIDIYISDFHRNMLFIKNTDRIIILSITRHGPRFLTAIQAPGQRKVGVINYQIAIAQNQLIIVQPPNIIQEHSLDKLYYNRSEPVRRNYPIYHYEIPQNVDLDFSDAGNLVYITAIDKNLPSQNNSVILVYRTGYPVVSALFDVIFVGGKYNQMLIDATGVFGDYIAVALRQQIRIYRQYQFPILVFQNSFLDFDFYVTFSNDPHQKQKNLSHSSVKVANYPPDIIVTDARLNKSGFLDSQVNYQNDQKTYIVNDSTWFKGGVVNYSLVGCNQCGDKIKLVNHVQHKRVFFSVMDMNDYTFTINGGVIQQERSIISMRHNGSINQFISLPSHLTGQNCKYVTFSFMYDFSVSACQYFDEVYFYMTNFINQKPFVLGPSPSSAKRVAGIQNMGQIFIIIDIDQQPSRMARQGGVLVYSLNHDPNQPELFDEIDFIDTNDLVAAQGWIYGEAIYISNAHLAYTNISSIYRLVITQLRFGIFFVDFRWQTGMKQLQITRVQFLNLREELASVHLTMPNNAMFEAVTISNQFYNSLWNYWQIQLIVTTHNFHIFQVNCFFDAAGSLKRSNIAKVFHSYGFYHTANYIKTFDGYFAITFVLPQEYQAFPWNTRRVVAVYDTKQRWSPMTIGDDVPVYYMLGGLGLLKGRISFDFNFTFSRNSTDPFRDIGLLILNNQHQIIHQTAINDYIAFVTKPGISSTQNAKVVAFNDFSKWTLPFNIVINPNQGALPPWAIVLIVFGSLAIGILGGFIAWRFYQKKKTETVEEPKKSLLENQAEHGQDNEEENQQGDGQDDDDEEDEQQKEKQQQQTPPKKQQKPAQKQAIPTPRTQPAQTGSINRQTTESQVPNQQIKVAQPGQKPQPPEQQTEGIVPTGDNQLKEENA